MRRRLELTSPCTEAWSAMTPTEDGRHCAKCEKTVVDLSRLTRREAVTVAERLGGALCGRAWSGPDGQPQFRAEPPSALMRAVRGAALAASVAAVGCEASEDASTPAAMLIAEPVAPDASAPVQAPDAAPPPAPPSVPETPAAAVRTEPYPEERPRRPGYKPNYSHMIMGGMVLMPDTTF